ncbi:hypothetical protein [Xanthobacter versatilis]|uniref:hypothetical protein n=1 Tax=Xanthobacter autotrophicus (strain ATCC BAA-1158 / Py2) TaxID=78245 RepID=UPI00372673E2
METLRSFSGIHSGVPIVIFGCGESLADAQKLRKELISIGISDVERFVAPTYLVLCNYRFQYPDDRLVFIDRTAAKYVFTNLKYLDFDIDNVIQVKPGSHAGMDFGENNCLSYSSTSAYFALCLAIHMGANLIGLLGIDFTDRHFSGGDRPHALSSQLPQINSEFRALDAVLRRKGVDVYNLSSVSKVTAFRFCSPNDFGSSASL